MTNEGNLATTQQAESLRRAISRQPGNCQLYIDLAHVLRSCGDAQGAHDALLQACRASPRSARAWHALGELFCDGAHAEQALYALGRARTLSPDDPSIPQTEANMLRMCGRSAEAAAQLRRAIALNPRDMRPWHALANLKTEQLGPDEITQMDTALAVAEAGGGGPAADEQRIFGRFALARALESAGDTQRSFALYGAANTLMRRYADWDSAKFSRQVDQCITAFASDSNDSEKGLGAEVIFIVSLPRSGSTLVEQMLASHPDVEGAGELTALGDIVKEESGRRSLVFPEWVASTPSERWHSLGEDYMNRTRRWRQRARFVDKSLTTWRLIGAARKMLPGARFVECRRDPVETCWSCFTQLFPRATHFSYDLEDVATMWHDYDRLMRFWKLCYPGVIHTLEHERLLADAHEEINALLAFLELPFDRNCLGFHESSRQVRTESATQVREPLRRSTARTTPFGSLLAPLRKMLGTRPGLATP
jgi:tetratricopeptide (TPR) repeat protein